MKMKVVDFYKQELVKRGYGSDPAQQAAIDRLQVCQDEWFAYKDVRSNTLKKWCAFLIYLVVFIYGVEWGAENHF